MTTKKATKNNKSIDVAFLVMHVFIVFACIFMLTVRNVYMFSIPLILNIFSMFHSLGKVLDE